MKLRTNFPVIGHTYHMFVNGVATLSRHQLALCTEIIPYKTFKKTYVKMYDEWKRRSVDEPWLYNDTTDLVVKCLVYPDYNPNDKEEFFFARDTDNGWFSFTNLCRDGSLDVTNSMWNEFLENARSGEVFDYGPDDMFKIELLNEIK